MRLVRISRHRPTRSLSRTVLVCFAVVFVVACGQKAPEGAPAGDTPGFHKDSGSVVDDDASGDTSVAVSDAPFSDASVAAKDALAPVDAAVCPLPAADGAPACGAGCSA